MPSCHSFLKTIALPCHREDRISQADRADERVDALVLNLYGRVSYNVPVNLQLRHQCQGVDHMGNVFLFRVENGIRPVVNLPAANLALF